MPTTPRPEIYPYSTRADRFFRAQHDPMTEQSPRIVLAKRFSAGGNPAEIAAVAARVTELRRTYNELESGAARESRRRRDIDARFREFLAGREDSDPFELRRNYLDSTENQRVIELEMRAAVDSVSRDERALQNLERRRKTINCRRQNVPYFGVELELEMKRGGSADLYDVAYDVAHCISDFAFLKSDASLTNGFEICTAPMTLRRHLGGAWERFFDCTALEHVNAFRSRNAGMHIHMSRAALSPLDISKLYVFINADENREFVERIAGRRFHDQWARRDPMLRWKAAFNSAPSRYVAVNNCGSETVELRFFKATTNKRSFLKNIEFAAATLQFLKGASASGLTSDAFVAWLRDPKEKHRRKDYANLTSWLDQYVRA